MSLMIYSTSFLELVWSHRPDRASVNFKDAGKNRHFQEGFTPAPTEREAVHSRLGTDICAVAMRFIGKAWRTVRPVESLRG